MTDFSGLLNALSNDRLSIGQLDAYFRGAQPINFLHPDLDDSARARLASLVINWPRLVISAIDERLDVDGFRLDSDAADDNLQGIWQDNDLDEWSQQCHQDAMVYGRSFVMVWPDADDPTVPRITVESAAQMAVEYDPTRRIITRAAKQWTEGDEHFLTVYSPTRIERFWSESPTGEAEWRLRTEPIPNLYGVVPVVPFVNRPRLVRPLGESELTDIIPMADAINKLATDMMVAAEFHAMPRRWATGIDLGSSPAAQERSREELRDLWSKAAADRVWTSTSHESQFGQFSEASLDNFVRAIDLFAGNIAAMAGLPPHYLGIRTDNPPSADALRSSEASLIQSVKRKQRTFGGSWERVMRLALRIQNEGTLPEGAGRMETIWRDPETPTRAQAADAAVKLVTAQVITREQAQEDLGYSPAVIKRMAEGTYVVPEKATLHDATSPAVGEIPAA